MYLCRHAGVYTRQEAIRISEGKLTKLQGLYIDQINRLHHTLKEKRREYLVALRKERETLCKFYAILFKDFYLSYSTLLPLQAAYTIS